MRERIESQENFEPERYELRESPAYTFALSRREFVGVVGAGLVISVAGKTALGQGFGAAARGPLESRLHLGEDGTVTILTGKVEIGQGARTEFAMAVAEEMRVPLGRVRVVMGDTDLSPNDGLTAGSGTTPRTIPVARNAAAVARELLLETAGKQWKTDRARLEVRDGVVTEPGGSRKLGYAELAKAPEMAAAYRAEAPSDAKTTPVKDWKILGKPHYRTDARDIVTGKHEYPSDIRRPEMLYGSVLRAPSYGATLAKVDLAPAQKLAGVTAVRDGSFVACAAKTSFAARQGVAAVAATAEWKPGEHPSSGELFTYLKQHVSKSRPPMVRNKGAVAEGLAQASRRVRAVYQVPFIQHAPMEPRAAVAEWKNGKLTVWTGTQNPFGVREQLMQAFHLGAEKVQVIVPDAGGGFGGKHTGEVAIEAARLAKEAGHPVSLRWTRAEEFMWAYFRPAGIFEMEAGLDGQGRLTAWDYTNYNSGTAALETPYRVAHARHQFVYCDSPMREGSYRGIAATANNFARECFMEELAEAAGKDPLEFRLANTDNPQLEAVMVEVAKRFGWQERRKQRRPGIGRGIAAGTEKGSFVAACAEVETDSRTGAVKLRDFYLAFECGAILNPSNLRSQVEGSIIQGLGGALTEAMEFENGKLKNGSFAKYPVPRFKDVPPMSVILMDRPDLAPAGAGETPIIAVAPAIAAAVFDATGERVRALPVRAKVTKA
jgi:CO/xanthine dehydrogenase Mo-binding subunit